MLFHVQSLGKLHTQNHSLVAYEKSFRCLFGIGSCFFNSHLTFVITLTSIFYKVCCVCAGVVQGSQVSTVQSLFVFLSPMLQECAAVLNVYHNYQQIVELILHLFCECARSMLCYLTPVRLLSKDLEQN